MKAGLQAAKVAEAVLDSRPCTLLTSLTTPVGEVLQLQAPAVLWGSSAQEWLAAIQQAINIHFRTSLKTVSFVVNASKKWRNLRDWGLSFCVAVQSLRFAGNLETLQSTSNYDQGTEANW